MRLIINIKKILMVINPVYEYITFNYKDYRHGHMFFLEDKIFSLHFKNEMHGDSCLLSYNYNNFWYENDCIYSDYYKYIILGGIEYELKK